MKKSTARIAAAGAAAIAGLTLAPLTASAETVDASCPIAVYSPYLHRTADGTFLRGAGVTPCSGRIRLMEERWWGDRVIASESFPADPGAGDRLISRLCNGGDLGDVYVQIRTDPDDRTKNSGSVDFGRCA